MIFKWVLFDDFHSMLLQDPKKDVQNKFVFFREFIEPSLAISRAKYICVDNIPETLSMTGVAVLDSEVVAING